MKNTEKEAMRARGQRDWERRMRRFFEGQLRELESYVETGELDWLRERALHGIREIMREVRKLRIRIDENIVY